MTFDLTPDQQALIANASSSESLPASAMDAVLVIEERVRIAGEATLQSLSGDSNTARTRLLAAGIALGIGRAAVAHAVASMKAANVVPGPDATVPHWAVADGATEVEAARLLTYSAAQALDRNESA